MVREFHRTFKLPHHNTPTVMPLKRAEQRYLWLQEEIDEFIDATQDGDLCEQVDAMIDTIYFALGTLVELGVEPTEIFKIVHAANMAKLDENGEPYMVDGKIIKPSDWVDPHEAIADVIKKQSRSVELNPDKDIVDAIRKRLVVTDGQCPCVPQTQWNQDTMCPCKQLKVDKHCCCGLYITIE